ncbi:MAG: rhodanese-like domain-containing protein [Capsulimonadales bacterium]|nr:rhodanese-like domain-containing protein [Capsulimonadales bacterium]
MSEAMSDSVNEPFRRLSPAEVEAILDRGDEVFVVDVREPRAFREGHISEAISLPADDFADRYSREISPDDPVIVVCQRGQTSVAAAGFLASQGFTNVSTMEGGMNAWNGPLQTRD